MDIFSLVEHPDWKERAARGFHEKWGIPLAAYLESMEECLRHKSAVPQWYLAVEEGRITEFTLTLRTYTPTGEVTPVPDHRLAAAALRSIPESDGSLVLCYTDNLSPGLTVGWMTQE